MVSLCKQSMTVGTMASEGSAFCFCVYTYSMYMYVCEIFRRILGERSKEKTVLYLPCRIVHLIIIQNEVGCFRATK